MILQDRQCEQRFHSITRHRPVKWSYMLLGPAMLLASCGLLDDPKRDTAIERGTLEVDTLAERLEESLQANVREVNRPWYGSSLPETETSARKPFSPLLSRPDSVLLQGAEDVTLEEIAVVIEQSTGHPVLLRRNYPGPDGTPVKVVVSERHPMEYQGSLVHVLDRVAARYDVFWDFDGTTINLEPMRIRRWTLPIPVGVTEYQQTSAGLGGGTTTVSTSTSQALDPWTSLENLLYTDLVAPASISVFRDLGQLVVLGRPSDHARVNRAIEEQLYIYRNRIGLEVGVYYVDTNELDQFNLQLTALLRRDSGQPFISTTGTAVPPTGSARVFDSQGVPDTEAVGEARNELILARAAEENAKRLLDNEVWTNEDGPTREEVEADLTSASANTAVAEGNLARLVQTANRATPATNFIDFQRLATNGAVVDYRQGSSVTLSGVATPIVISRIRNYISSQSQDEEGRITLETDTIDEGVSIHAIPRLVGPGQIQLSLTVLQNSLISLDNFSTPSATVQLPTTDHRAISSDTLLRPGETLILSGYEQERISTSKASGFLGIGRGGRTGKIRMVVLVRPALLGLPG